MNEALKKVTIYTDGSAEPNPGRGGYGVVVLVGNERKELSGGFRLTTNNRMEVLAAIFGLEALHEPCVVTVHSDSQYLVNAIEKGWARKWRAKGWWRNKEDRAINIDLWERLLLLCETHTVEFVWVRGHSGIRENERADGLSILSLDHDDLPPDEGYENRQPEEKITREGQPCLRCSTPVIKKASNHKWKRTETLKGFVLYCTSCHWGYRV